MKTIIAGGRDFTDYGHMCESLGDAIGISEVVCGKARGADSLGERWAKEHDVPVKEFPANWNLYGKSAGMRRNREMAEYADMLVAFWDGKSRGTANMIQNAKALGLKVLVISYKMGGEL